MTRWDLVYKWSDPETQSLVDAVTSALENCDRKLAEAAQGAAPRRKPDAQDAVVTALQLIVQWDAARKSRVLPQSLRNRAIHALGVWGARHD